LVIVVVVVVVVVFVVFVAIAIAAEEDNNDNVIIIGMRRRRRRPQRRWRWWGVARDIVFRRGGDMKRRFHLNNITSTERGAEGWPNRPVRRSAGDEEEDVLHTR